MVATTIFAGIFIHLRNKWINIASRIASNKTNSYGKLAHIFAILVVIELLIFFGSSIVCGIIKFMR